MLTYYFGGDNFKKSFLVEGILLRCIGFAIIQIPNVYFTSDLLLYKGKYRDSKYKKGAKNIPDEEDTKSIEDKESIYRYRYRYSGISTKDDYAIVILYRLAKNKRYVCGLISFYHSSHYHKWI